MFGRQAKFESVRKFRIILSESHDPVYNLSLEEDLFSTYGGEDSQEILLLYVNERSVIIGKHQNPWKECDLQWLFKHKIPLLRRLSGGGTVFHDSGNIIWSFISPVKRFSQEENLSIIRDAAQDLSGLPAKSFTLSSQGDIYCGGFKVSGNALTFRGGKVLHHGTLLVNSDINFLKKSLRGLDQSFDLKISGTAVESRPAQVATLSGLIAELFLSSKYIKYGKDRHGSNLGTVLSDLLVKQFLQKGFSCRYESSCDPTAKTLEKNASHIWKFRRTPRFHIHLSNKQIISVDKGVAFLSDGYSIDMATPDGMRRIMRYLGPKK